MKAKTIWIVMVAIFVIAALFFGWRVMQTQKVEAENKIYTFDLSDYSRQLEDCRYEKNVGMVATKAEAIEKAKTLWAECYSDLYIENFGKLYEDDGLPLEVAYDANNECWRVNGTLQQENDNLETAVPQALIKKDGTVLALWIG